AELVFDHGDLHAVLLVQDAFEQRGFAAAQKAGEDGHGNHVGRHIVSPVLCGVNLIDSMSGLKDPRVNRGREPPDFQAFFRRSAGRIEPDIETYLRGRCRTPVSDVPAAGSVRIAPGAVCPRKTVRTMADHAICNNRPFRYSPSGNAVSSGWSTPAPRRLGIRASTRASAAAPAAIFWNSSESIAPEQE